MWGEKKTFSDLNKLNELVILLKDSRYTQADIARYFKVTRGAINQRLRTLEAQGIVN